MKPVGGAKILQEALHGILAPVGGAKILQEAFRASWN